MYMIPKDKYSEILELIPIICVDGMIIDDKNRFLLLKRNNEPEKNKWWFPGGRLIKGELMEDAIKRKIKLEIGLDVEIVKELGPTQTYFETGPFGGSVHTINFTYLLKIKGGEISIDKDHSDYKWCDHVEESLHKELKRIINKAYD